MSLIHFSLFQAFNCYPSQVFDVSSDNSSDKSGDSDLGKVNGLIQNRSTEGKIGLLISNNRRSFS